MNKYLDPKKFVDMIDNTFWNHITKQGIVRDVVLFRDIKKEDFLYELARRINSGNYRPQATKIIGFPKNNGVIRPILHFCLEDTIVYYYCVKELQQELSDKINSVEFVFGGFRLTEKLSLKEESIENFIYDPNYELFVKHAFRKAWSDYQNLAKRLSQGEFDYYMHLDIAHFYDAIPLNKLEQEIRNTVANKKNIIDLLFYLLKNIKTVDNYSYTENIVGIPQEEVGEMSRLLANFYLSYFDNKIIDELIKLLGDSKGVEWQYTRYADDLWFAFRGEKSTALRITQVVAQILSDLSLHLNESKTKIMTLNEYNSYWCFSDWDYIMFYKNDSQKMMSKLKELYSQQNTDCRWFTPFNYILKVLCTSINENNSIVLNESDFIIDIIINNPSFASRNNEPIIDLLIVLFKHSEEYQQKILIYLTGSEIMYPLVSFVLWNAFFSLPYKEEVYESLSKRFYSEKWRDLWWYERCLFFNYYIEKKVYEINESTLVKLLSHIENIADNLPDYERRYIIRLLMRLPDQMGKDLLEKKFTGFNDRRLIEYIKKPKKC